jgi:hypothetical protein
MPRGIASPAQFRSQFHRVFDPPELIKQVIQSAPGVAVGHPWAGKSHDLTSHFALRRFIAMDGTVCTSGFVRSVGAFFEPFFGVLHQFRAFGTEIRTFPVNMMVIAIDARHAHKRVVLTLQSACDSAHNSIIGY